MIHDHYGLAAPDGSAPRVAIYPRVSTPQQERHGQGFQYQLKALPAEAERRNWPIAGNYQEGKGVSADSLSARPAMQRLLADARAGKFEIALALSYDRFSRGGPKDWGEIMETCDETGLVLMTPTGVFYDPRDENTKGNVWMFGFIAQRERLTTRQRSMDVRNAMAKEGQAVMGWLPHGFRIVQNGRRTKGSNGRVGEHDPETAPVIERIFRWMAEGERGAYSLSVQLNAEGIPSPAAYRKEKEGIGRAGVGKWGPGTILRLIRHPAYYGEAPYGRSECRMKAGRCTKKELPPEAWKKCAVPPIVSYDLWRAANAAVGDRRGRSGRPVSSRPKALLAGLLRCSECERIYHAHTQRHAAREYCYYRCNGKRGGKFGGPPVCASPGFRAEYIEPLIWAAFQGLLDRPERLLEAAQREAEAQEPKIRRQDPALLLKRLDEREAKYWRSFDDDELTGAEIRPRLDAIAAERRAIEARIAGERETEADRKRQLGALSHAVETLRQLRDENEDPSDDRKRAMLAAAVREIRVEPGPEFRIHLKVAGMEFQANGLAESDSPMNNDVVLSANGAVSFVLARVA